MPETATDEQELAKALDSVANLGGSAPSKPDTGDNVHDSGVQPIVPPGSPIAPPAAPAVDNNQSAAPAVFSMMPTPSPAPVSDDSSTDNTKSDDTEKSEEASHTNDEEFVAPDSSNNSDTTPLDSIKSEALNELRPLVGKLDLNPEEKFDTYLLLIRSTDDADLIAPAHEAAKAISDETRRAQALLDIIKEIDYLSHQKNNK